MQITTISFEENPQLLKAFREVAKAVGAKITVKNQAPKTPTARLAAAMKEADEIMLARASGKVRGHTDLNALFAELER